jgi:hypothetical protein
MPEQIKRIDIGDLTEAVTTAVHRTFEAQKLPRGWPYSRIIIGIILDPGNPWQPGQPGGPSKPQ